MITYWPVYWQEGKVGWYMRAGAFPLRIHLGRLGNIGYSKRQKSSHDYIRVFTLFITFHCSACNNEH